VSAGSDESRACVAALSTELVAVLLGSSPAVVVSEVPGAEAPSAFDPSRYPDRHKVLVLVGSAKRPIPERSWYSTCHDAAGGTVMTALPPGAFLDMFDDAITRQDPQHWLLAINAARWQHHPAEVLASIMAVAEITSSASRVFISYRRLETQSLAVQLFDALTHEGFETFLDRFSIPVGLDFQRRLTQELEDKSMVVLLESRFLKDSKWTQHEVDFVKQYRLGLATLRMPDVRESDRLPIRDDWQAARPAGFGFRPRTTIGAESRRSEYVDVRVARAAARCPGASRRRDQARPRRRAIPAPLPLARRPAHRAAQGRSRAG